MAAHGRQRSRVAANGPMAAIQRLGRRSVQAVARRVGAPLSARGMLEATNQGIESLARGRCTSTVAARGSVARGARSNS